MTRRSSSSGSDRKRRSRSRDRYRKRKKESKSRRRSRTPVKKSRRHSRSKSPRRSKRRSSSRSPSRSYSKDTYKSSKRSSSRERNRSESRAKEGVYPRKLPTRRSRSRTRTPERPKLVEMPSIDLKPIFLSSETNKSTAISAIESGSFVQSAFKSGRNAGTSSNLPSSSSILDRNPTGNSAYAQFKREQDHEKAIFGKSSPLTIASLTEGQDKDGTSQACISILELQQNVIHPRLNKNMNEAWKKWVDKLLALREEAERLST